MKNLSVRSFFSTLLFICICLCAAPLFAAGLLTPKDGSLPSLSLKEHHVKVTVEDGYVVTRIDQTFSNPHNRDLEALYTFPVPEAASVAEFSLWIDGRKVPGEVLEKQAAKQVYEEEKAAGREAGLTEKNELNSFEISVFPVRASDTTKMRLTYIQPANVDTGMGRYVYPLESGGVDDIQESFWTANEKVEEAFSFIFNLRSSIAVDGVRVPGFPQAAIHQKNPREWTVSMGNPGQADRIDNGDVAGENGLSNRIENADRSGENGHGNQIGNAVRTGEGRQLGRDDHAPEGGQNAGQAGGAETSSTPARRAGQGKMILDKDMVVYWRQVDNVPARVDMVTYKPEIGKQGTFMITVTPGDDLKKIREGRDWVFILDKSGSMQGKFQTLLQGVEKALGRMSGKDRFRIIMFENRASEVTRGYVAATPANVKAMVQRLFKESPGGGTNLYGGLKKALKSVDADRTTSLVLVTDGVANVGITRQADFVKLMKKRDLRLFTFMMGNSTNTFLLKHLADVSNGFAQSVSNSDDIVGQIISASSKVTHEALHGVKLSISGITTGDITTNNTGTLYRGEQLIVFGHYSGGGKAALKLKGKISGQEKTYETAFEFPDVSNLHPEIQRLWAYARIQEIKRAMVLQEDDKESEQAIIALSKDHGIVTDYTSMLVVRDEVFQKRGIKRTNKKRLETEEIARDQRAQAPVLSTRVDTAKPMYTTNRPTHRGSSGSGALDIWFLLGLLLLPAFKKMKPST